MSYRREVQEMLRKLEALGCAIEQRKSGHWRITHRDLPIEKPFVTCPYSPDGTHTAKNVYHEVLDLLGLTRDSAKRRPASSRRQDEEHRRKEAAASIAHAHRERIRQEERQRLERAVINRQGELAEIRQLMRGPSL